MKERVNAAIGPPGVIGDSARGKISRGTWETQRRGEFVANGVMGINNRHSASLGVGGVHSSEEAANHRGAKGPY